MWARIENGTVFEVTDIDPEGRFHASIQWEECGEDVKPGYVLVDGGFSKPEMKLAEAVESASSGVERGRKQEEAEGVIHNGIRYAGDQSNRQAIMEALNLADATGQTTFSSWKDSDGNFHSDLPVDDVRQALMKIAERRGDLIAREAELNNQINIAFDAGDRQTLQSIEW